MRTVPPTMRCSEPGHRALVAVHAPHGPVAELGLLWQRNRMDESTQKRQRPEFNLFIRVVATLLVLARCAIVGLLMGFVHFRLTH